MESINKNMGALGIPPIISTASEGSDDSDLGDLMDRIQNAIGPGDKDLASACVERDESTADETYLESSPGSSYESDEDEAAANEDEDDASESSDDDGDFSIQSHHTNDTARDLLKQAQQRIKQQSVYEELKQLRAEMDQYRDTAEAAQRDKLEVMKQCTSLQRQLTEAMEMIHSYKQKELRWNEEKAMAEKDFMNQLTDVCKGNEANEKNLMEEILKRDMKIIELQNNWNEQEVKRMMEAREKEKSDIVNYIETKQMKEMNLDDDSWDDESSCEFI